MDLLQRLNNASDNAVVYFHLLNMASRDGAFLKSVARVVMGVVVADSQCCDIAV